MDIRFDADLIRRYDRPGPRYTSYPTAPQFHGNFGAQDYVAQARASNAGGRPLSLYLHIPYCRSSCYYCGCNRIITRNRERGRTYLDRLLVEIRMQAALFDRSRAVDQLHFGGGTPTYYTPEELGEIFTELRAGFGLHAGSGRDYGIEIDPRTADPTALRALVELGINRISLGVQDFDPAVQRAVNRVQSVDETACLVQEARAAGIRSINFDLIYGLPLQTVASFEGTLEQVLALRPDRIAAYSYAHLPEMFKAQAVIDPATLPAADTRMALLEATIARLTAAGYVHIGMDHYALPGEELAVAQRDGSLQRNFQGYTTHGGCDLIGLGMSAIGQVGDCYAQNEKHEISWLHALGSGRLPIQRGLLIDADDRLRRETIGQIMCFGRIDYDQFRARHGIDFREYFATSLTRLRQPCADGLVELRDDGLAVTPAGALLLRVIAMAFDAYLSGDRQAQAVPARYSRVV
ncbi:MAG: oxygen-independent coproporphyrinogen III oxidase [Xanthomonadales bacterium]|nr:Oxygen-independent coproporphyrinogen III oxidase [Xanthomonadales bacterium]MCC6592140.1 oxygen-independent coproporphyrinogen III oxidase [Xanthomonadales bacterium]MCE7931137.1 oxygen-independent coproporphyrinogen III oxidase [Xanthomonadales bacterium PRO6]